MTDIVLDLGRSKGIRGRRVEGQAAWEKQEKKVDQHIGIDPKTGKLIVEEATKREVYDHEAGCRLFESLKAVKNVYGYGAYDTKVFYEAVEGRGGKAIVPPRRGAIVGLPEKNGQKNVSLQKLKTR